jgi:hypothetical protein
LQLIDNLGLFADAEAVFFALFTAFMSSLGMLRGAELAGTVAVVGVRGICLADGKEIDILGGEQ